ncbi:MAG: C1 family peptidase [Candidatus Eremiobacteraeota bacterium]|nr:C1 family peptidase [Candidatus Eremiobacteraeota bacterium]
MSVRHVVALGFSALAALALVGCGGSHASLPGLGQYARLAGPPASTPVQFRVYIPSSIVATSNGRRVEYVSSATKSMVITEQPAAGGPPISGIANCTSSVCSGSIVAPLGMGTFTISLYDGMGGGGNLLSRGSKMQTIVPNVANIVSVTFNPAVASVIVSVAPTALQVGSPGVTFISIIAKDADGNTIVGPGSFSPAIRIISSDTTGAITLPQTTLTDVGQKLEVDYNGALIANPVFSASQLGTQSVGRTIKDETPGTLSLFADEMQINGDFTGDIPDSAQELDGIPFDDQTSGGESILRQAQALRRPALYGQPGGTGALPSKVDLSSQMSPVLNQGQQGSCGAFSLSYAILSYQEKLVRNWSYFLSDGVTVDYTHVFSPAFLYNQVNGGMDSGSTLTGNLAFVAQNGNSSWSDMPYTDTNFTNQPSATAKQNALQFRILQYARIDPKNITAVKMQLAAGNAIYWAMPVDNNFQALTGMQVWRGPLQPGAGGHAMALAGYDDSLGAFIIRNSWGTSWGNNGYGYIDYNAFANNAYDAFVLKVADLSSPNVPNPLPTPSIAATGWNPSFNGPTGTGFQMTGTLSVSPLNAMNAQVQVGVYYVNPDGSLGGRVPMVTAQYADLAGNAATGTPVMPVPAGGLQANWTAYMPYSALPVLPGQSITMGAYAGLVLDGVEYPLSSGYTFTVTNTGGVLTGQSFMRSTRSTPTPQKAPFNRRFSPTNGGMS